jgi:opacity protein-like surface antigen
MNTMTTTKANKSKNTLSRLAASVALAGMAMAAPSIASADDDTGFYIGASYNDVEIEYTAGDRIRFSDDEKTAGYRAGYMFTNNFGVDVGYLDLGTYAEANVGLLGGTRLEAEATTVSVVFNVTPIDYLDVYARLGAAKIEQDRSITVAGAPVNFDPVDDTKPFGAVGVAFDLGAIDLFAEYSKLDTDDNDVDLDIVSAGVKFEFGSN